MYGGDWPEGRPSCNHAHEGRPHPPQLNCLEAYTSHMKATPPLFQPEPGAVSVNCACQNFWDTRAAQRVNVIPLEEAFVLKPWSRGPQQALPQQVQGQAGSGRGGAEAGNQGGAGIRAADAAGHLAAPRPEHSASDRTR